MRRLVLFLMAGVAVVGPAQEDPATARPGLEDSPYYVKNVFVHRIISTRQGYRIEYLTSRMEPVAVYIPIEWFNRTNPLGRTADGGAKAEFLYGDEPSFPYMTIFWKNGRFSHIRVFARYSYADPSWGVLPHGLDISGRFKPDQEPVFRF